MKKNVLAICCILCAITTLSAQKVIDLPSFESANRTSLKIQQIELTDSATILRMKINYDPSKFWSINENSYILVDNNPEPLMVKHAQGIDLGERMYTKNGTSLFALYFPPIDTLSEKIDFIESDCNACYRIMGMKLSGTSINQVYDESEYQAVKASNNDAFIQENDSNDDLISNRSSATYDGASYNIMFSWKKKAKNPHWAGAGMALANFDGMNGTGADLKVSTSYSFVINPIDYCVPLDYHWLFVSGAGIDWTRYHFKSDMGLEEVNGITQFVPAPEGTTYNSSKLLAYYITIPVLLEYQTRMSNRKTFFVSGGIVGYIKCYSKSQVDLKVSGGIEKINKGRDLNILPVNARAMFQIGISDISVYAYYSPFSMFEKDKGPDIKPIGIGMLLGF